MTSALTIECTVQFRKSGRGVCKRSKGELNPNSGRLPRVSRWMALAIRLDQLLRAGEVPSHAELARLGHVSLARVSQIMSLLSLAPDIQEEILFLSRRRKGRDPILLRHLLPIAAVADWKKQRARWKALASLTN